MAIFRSTIGVVLASLFIISASNLAEDHAIFYGRHMDAERYTVVEQGGYFPVLAEKRDPSAPRVYNRLLTRHQRLNLIVFLVPRHDHIPPQAVVQRQPRL